MQRGDRVGTFNSKTVLVMGGSRGIGAAIVRRFAREGATVHFTYQGSRVAAESIAKETGARSAQVDSADRKAVTAHVASCGALDILVINAGVLEAGDPTTIAPEAVERLFAVNIHAPYFAAVEASKKMRDNGRIVIIGSVNGDTMPFQGLTAYAVSKSAVQGLARGLSRDLGPRGITVNVVQPGPVDTEMNPANGPMKDAMHAGLSIKRHGRVDEVAAMVAFLAGPDAGFITGAMHTIDGGLSA
jgi:cyclic-di-GMP-binding biofilm dispersal mediator protein